MRQMIKKLYPNGYYVGYGRGWYRLQVQMQLTLLFWGLEFDIARWAMGVRIGPLAVKVWL